jgi:hypothetical protein
LTLPTPSRLFLKMRMMMTLLRRSVPSLLSTPLPSMPMMMKNNDNNYDDEDNKNNNNYDDDDDDDDGDSADEKGHC